MNGRLGNGMVFWLGGALLAHAALLAVPGHSPEGRSDRAGSLQVQLLAAGSGETPTDPPTQSTESNDPAVPSQDASAQGREALADPTESILDSPSARPAIKVSMAVPAATVSRPPPLRADARPARTGSEQAGAGVPPTPHPVTATTGETATPVTASMATAPSGAATPEPTEPAAHGGTATTVPLPSSQPLALVAARSPGTEGADEVRGARLLELTNRLHHAIERQKRYPLGARRLGREGSTRVAFTLHPDGDIDDLEVSATSGEPVLDRAALRAVSRITPFTEAGGYLDQSAPFRVDIAFRLR